ncbi:hypothetical protein HH1059_07100 [Halorhodospira halochloris]|uniref:Uncharacterized protein n=1 Tax=Halorhodospira halochloris TaxID=1052 RepID=A0A110B4U3_HALHR|nr:hypothetical protein [Halorhodospira halochloris]MBK1651129.1 hypothetical protein [Halorhodospira halochloris]BAU57398.1 hypothetical protein HH1059_07100 [Halorhodospira halochloris]
MTDSIDEQQKLKLRLERLDQACHRLAQTSSFAKFTHSSEVIEAARRALNDPGGAAAVYQRIGELTDAGIFSGSDWETPEILQPEMAANTLKLSSDHTLILECLSELRLLAILEGELPAERISVQEAKNFLARVLALNIHLIFGETGEAERVRLGRNIELVRQHQSFILERVGFDAVVEELITEIWRILQQRPIQIEHVKLMITNVAVYLNSDHPGVPIASTRGAERLISALYGPTRGCHEDPGLDVFAERITSMDEQTLRNEALGFGRSMHDTGLVSPYHAIFLRYITDHYPDLIPATLGLSSTGVEVLGCFSELIHRLIREAVWPQTAQSILGLAGLIERGVLYNSPVPPSLWRQIHLELCPAAQQRLNQLANPLADDATGPTARVRLLAGVINILGHPLGVGQGNNPTCQSARALSMWSTNDPDYLLQVIAWAARDNDVISHFEGRELSSAKLLEAHQPDELTDVDPVSAVAVPHLDVIYMEMGRRCIGRGEDPHRWVNMEFHGWWVGRGFAIAVDVASGNLHDLEGFVRRFYACYHPLYNGNNPVIHSQPAGIAVTDASGRFVGWHAISIERVSLDPEGVTRVYFFNPNNDSTQDWGNGVLVSTEGCGEYHGESSLPFEEFVSRLYIFHFDPRDEAPGIVVADDAMARIRAMVEGSWGAGR